MMYYNSFLKADALNASKLHQKILHYEINSGNN